MTNNNTKASKNNGDDISASNCNYYTLKFIDAVHDHKHIVFLFNNSY